MNVRTSKPGAGNKNYIRKTNGGWSPCVKGNPTDANCNVLSNCVGYACGRFNEIYNEIMGTTGCKYSGLCCNAENFVERAVKVGLKTGSEPRVGAIICWQKGATLKSSDGAGHVAFVEKVIDSNTIYTSESAYNGKAFYNSTRSNSNGRWGIGSAYKFRCFIYQPDEVEAKLNAATEVPSPVEPEPTPVEPTVSAEWPKYHVVTSKDTVSGLCKQYYGKSTKTLWDLIKNANNLNDKYTIINGKTLTIPDPNGTITPAPIPAEPAVVALQVGDKVKIIGTGNGNVNGKGHTAYGIGWTRQVLKI